MRIQKGKSLNDWAIPLHIFAGKPYTDSMSRCLMCCCVMYEMKDAEGRLWHVCGHCGAQVPVETGFTEIGKK